MCQSCRDRAVDTYRTATGPGVPHRGDQGQSRGGRGRRGRECCVSTYTRQTGSTVTLPASLNEAVAALAAMPAAVPVAGGTDLMSAVNSGLLRPAALVGLGRISEIRGWQYPASSWVSRHHFTASRSHA